VAFLDIGVPTPVRWTADTPVGVGLVDIDALGLRALAVEEAPPTATVHVYEGSSGATRWTRLLSGSVARADSGAAGGAALSPDGRHIGVATLRGDVLMLDAEDGDLSWSYRAGGAGVVTFAHDDPRRVLVGARLLENHASFDTVLLFSTAGEPLGQRAPLLAGAILAAATVALSLLVGLGYWRARKPY
jgi:outer membrane protein assembly factor BamB